MLLAPRSFARALAVAALAVGALAGCGSPSGGSAGVAASLNPAPPSSESADSPTGSVPVSPVGSAQSPVGDTSSSGGADLTDNAVCATLPAQTAKKLTGLDIAQALPLAAGPDSGAGCGYSSDDSSVQVQVKVFSSGSAMDSWEAVSQGSNHTTITGLGDKAFYDNEGTLYALKDSRLLQVNGVQTQDQAVALATAVLALL